MATEIRRPTSFTDASNDWSDENLAYDGNTGTYAQAVAVSTDPIVFITWQTATVSYTSLTLYVRAEGTSDDGSIIIQYSTNGGNTWTPWISLEPLPLGTYSVSLSPSQDLSQFQVRVYNDGEFGDNLTRVYEVWTEGSYLPPRTQAVVIL